MENKDIVNEFGDLLGIYGVIRDVKVGSHVIRMRSLTYDEQSIVLGSVPADAKNKLDVIQKELLVAAIETIDDKKIDSEQKRFLLGNGQAALCNLLFNEYEALMGEQSKLLEDVKKNSSAGLKKTP